MSQRLLLNVDAVDQEIIDRAPGARIELQRDTTSAFGAPTNLASTPLEAAKSQYWIFDPDGTTSSWYRFRLTTNTGTIPSAWSAALQGGAVTAYATLFALREYLNPPDNSQDNLLTDLLIDASAYLDMRCGRDFYRHPQVTGTEIRSFPGTSTRRLDVPAGIVSLTDVAMAPYTGATYTVLAATDWWLEPANLPPDRTWYSAVILSDVGTQSRLSPGNATVRLTGVFGASVVPPLIRKATLDLAREWYRQGPGGGGPVGVNQYGTPIFGGAEPKSVRDAIAAYAIPSWVVA